MKNNLILDGVIAEWIPFCNLPNGCTVVVLNNQQSAVDLYNVFTKTEFTGRVVFLPQHTCEIYETSIEKEEIFYKRAYCLSELCKKNNLILVTTLKGLNYKVPPIEFFAEDIDITVGDQVSIARLSRLINDLGYIQTDLVNACGTYAVRGGIIDIYTIGYSMPTRIEFLGDEIEKIKQFDIGTQLTINSLKNITIRKCSEIILNDKSQRIFENKYHGDDIRMVDAVKNGIKFPGIEWFQDCLYEKTATILDYLPKDTEFIFDFELEKINKVFFEDCHRRYSETKNMLHYNKIFSDLIKEAKDRYKVHVLNPFYKTELYKRHIKIYDIRKQFELSEFLYNLKKTTILSFKTRGSYNLAMDLLQKEDINEIEKFDEAVDEKINLIISELDTGFDTKKYSVYTEQELFGEVLRFRKKKSSKDLFKDYSKLSIGDYVIHEKHGLALFDGLVTLDVSGISHEFVCLVYQNNDKLYVPIEDISLITRYGDATSAIQLDYLKSSAWTTRKQKVQKKLLVIANDLLQLAANRKINRTIPYKIPANYEEFCKRFGHIETDDQLSAINDVIDDLSGEIPMDRLVCGDVGFGKTEVALRASFVVASSLKQVVLLAPTTILVSQHYNNFMKRFAGFDISICQLSRFVSSKQLKMNIEDIKSGNVSIIIATHTVLSDKITFADLGLVIVDEEQHFGVKQKEFLKKYHNTAHFMTLSATPIPRTLQLAMTGVKELSMITTPPTDRLPVKTLICNYNKDTFKKAIEHEIKAGGQVFIVTPRVEFLEELYNYVSSIFPNLRIAKVCGKTANIEEILRDFCEFKIDILVSTNIIDSGIDIPNANTIIIHRFDLFGLSQLYQLRGRVGRSQRQGYAYLLLDDEKILTDSAKKRLEVLSELNKLGSGFNLATYDLDIRGAGNLLGEEQSGYIKDVGIELYQSMLRETIMMIKSGEKLLTDSKKNIQINLGVPVLIPEIYVNDVALRLETYRRIGALVSEVEVDAMEYELYDRFGSIPFETKNLLTLMRIKIYCQLTNIEKLDVGANGLTFSFFENQCKNVDGVMKFLHSDIVLKNSGSFKIHNDQRIVILKKWSSLNERTNNVFEMIKELNKNINS